MSDFLDKNDLYKVCGWVVDITNLIYIIKYIQFRWKERFLKISKDIKDIKTLEEEFTGR